MVPTMNRLADRPGARKNKDEIKIEAEAAITIMREF